MASPQVGDALASAIVARSGGKTDSVRKSLRRLMFRRQSGRSLAAFRIMFGLIMAVSWLRALYLGWIRAHHIEPAFHFTFMGFGWVEPLPGDGPIYLAWAMVAVSLLLAAGVRTRLMAAVLCLGVSYELLLDKALYLNHIYLAALLSGMLALVPCDRAMTLPRLWRKTPPEQVRAWGLWLLRGQLLVVYFFSGVSKLQSDWLQCMPLRMTFSRFDFLPVIGPVLTQSWFVALCAYGILLLEIFSPILFYFERTRRPALLAFVVFHLATAVFYNIGIFPWLCLSLLTLLLSPDWPARLIPAAWRVSPSQAPRLSRRRKRHILWALASYAAIQVLLPLRPLLYPGDASWTREGHHFTWRLLLSHKSGWARFVLTDPESGASDTLSAHALLTPWQVGKMAVDPDMIQQFAQRLASEQRAKGFRRIQVRVESAASLNGRPFRPLIDAQVDLAAQPRSLGHSSWIRPLTEPLPERPIVLDGATIDANMWGGPILYRHAQALQQRGKMAEAAEAYRSFLLVDPEHFAGRMNLALVLRRAHRFEAAEQELKAVLRDRPERPEPWRDLVRVYIGLQDYERARNTLRRAQAQHPQDAGLRALAAQLVDTP